MTRNGYLIRVAIVFSLALIITLLLISSAVSAHHGGTVQQGEPYRTDTFEIDGPGDLEVRTAGGHITVEGSETSTMRIEMLVRKNGQNLTPQDTDLDDWDISITQAGNSVNASAQRQGRSWSFWGDNNISISFVVYTPKEMNTRLKTSGGHIETNNLIGSQMVSTSGGHLQLHNLDGTLEAKTSGGHISLQDINGNSRAKTSGGHIEAMAIDGDLSLQTSGGRIALAEIRGSIEARTSGGSINADLSTIESLVTLRTSGGNVHITIPDRTGLELNLKGSFVDANLSEFSGKIERDEISGRLFGGGPELSARTSGGTVSLSFQ